MIKEFKKLNKDICVDKYHNGWVTFPKGTKVLIIKQSNLCNYHYISVEPLVTILVDQPKTILVTMNDLEDI